MRTLRELAGWGLLLGAWLLPVALLVALAAWVDGEIPFGGFLLAALVGCAWPRLVLSSRRLREPDPQEVAEADERRPVLLLHAFTHVRRPLLARLFAFQPDLWRDWLDHLTERALARSFGEHGPVIALARPAPPPDHGPIRPTVDTGWQRTLEHRLRTASRVIVVVDESDACLHEIVRAAELLGLSRVVLVPSWRTSDAVRARWAELADAIPGLPQPDGKLAAIRFSPDGTPAAIASRFGSRSARLALLRNPRAVLRPGEVRAGPRAPSVAKLLPLLPALAGLFSALTTPIWLDVNDVSASGDDFVAGGFAVFFLGVALAVLARRAVRLVPSNEGVLVLLASLPWMFTAFGLAVSEPWRLSRGMKYAAIGAAYSTPLLLAVGLTLAGGALIRQSPERSRAYALFGAAALIPLGTLGVSLAAADAELALFLIVLLAGAAIMALVAAAASGRAGRAHAPLPIGAASAAALGVGAWASVMASAEWRSVMGATDYTSFDVATVGEAVGALATFDRAWPWFVLLAPAVVTLIAAQFAGRASRVSVGSVAALGPVLLVLTLHGAGHALARDEVASRNAGISPAMIEALAGAERAPNVRLAVIPSTGAGWDPTTAGIDVLVDEAGAHAEGRLVAVPVQLAQRGRGTIGLQRAFTAAPADVRPARIAVGPDADGLAVVGAVKVGLALGGDRAELVLRGHGGQPTTLPLAPRIYAVDGRPFLHMIVRPASVTVRHGDYEVHTAPDVGGRLDETGVREALYTVRQQDPNNRSLIVVPTAGARADRLAAALGCAWDAGYDDLALEDAVR